MRSSSFFMQDIRKSLISTLNKKIYRTTQIKLNHHQLQQLHSRNSKNNTEYTTYNFATITAITSGNKQSTNYIQTYFRPEEKLSTAAVTQNIFLCESVFNLDSNKDAVTKQVMFLIFSFIK